ncbi:MAG: exodeoxyribonuclease V alpha subunit [Oleiphilaceae bacterium]|jgi:exodeoxyribonuclease V alpha subunit
MSLLTHPFLKHLANRIDKDLSPLRWIDLYSAQYVADCHQKESVPLAGSTEHVGAKDANQHDIVVLALMVSFVSSKGQTFLQLDNLPNDVLATYKFQECAFPEWLLKLSQSNAIRGVVCDIESSVPLEQACLKGLEQAPLILWQGRLYLARYWRLHQSLEHWLHTQSIVGQVIDEEHLIPMAKQLKDVFQLSDGTLSGVEKDTGLEALNWQAVSAAHTLVQNFSIITGGPGTGKTTTAASLLYLLMQRQKLQCSESNKADTSLKVRLLAPTGKAAIKLADSIRHHLVSIESRLLGADLKSIRMSDCLPKSGETIHRFLYEQGALRDSLNQHRLFSSEEVLLGQKQGRQANVDIVIIDEASMIDLALMVELIQVIPPNAQVIMLGDHFQLPAVEPGQVFAECVERYERLTYSHHLARSLAVLSGYDAIKLRNDSQLKPEETESEDRSEADFHPLCQLRKTYRFGGDLKTAAEQIKLGQSRLFKKQFAVQAKQETEQAVRWHVMDDNTRLSLVSGYRAYFECIQSKTSLPPLDILVKVFECFQLLCSTHEGPLGVVQMNELIEHQFVHQHEPQRRYGNSFYHGKAILVTRNHPHLGVFNGDVGFVMAGTKTTNSWNIHFPLQDQTALIVSPGRLREWQPAYAMTVHKSQGSEYQHVGIVLADYAKELLSKALLYTALTRSKSSCDIWAGNETLEQAFK